MINVRELFKKMEFFIEGEVVKAQFFSLIYANFF